MSKLRGCKIVGYGTYLPDRVETFGENNDQARYRVEDGVTQLDMLSAASLQAMETSETDPLEIDCFIGAVAVGPQPMPSTAALLKERVGFHSQADAFDVGASCASFLYGLDQAADLIATERAQRVLVASGDVGSRFLNPNHRESFELFSDAGTAVIVGPAENDSQGIMASLGRNYSANAHDTEIPGGLTAHPPELYADDPERYLFHMAGRMALTGIAKAAPELLQEFFDTNGLGVDDFDLLIPHQASVALGLIMNRIGVPEDKYINWVSSHGNMVSASIPYILCELLKRKELEEGKKVLLCGTAAGLNIKVVGLEL